VNVVIEDKMENKVAETISRNIQSVRKKKRLTLDQLSSLCGVSKAMISQIETGKANPTVATLWKISRGLEKDINYFLKGMGEAERTFHVQRSHSLTILDTEEDGLHIKVLSPFSMVEDLEMYLLTFQPGGKLESSPHFKQTEEFLTVIKGSVRVAAGSNNSELHAGDFIRYHCDIEHAIYNISNSEAIVHMVVRFHTEG